MSAAIRGSWRVRACIAGVLAGAAPFAHANVWIANGWEPSAEIASVIVIGKRYPSPVTSSGTKTETAVRNIPQSITIVTSEQVRDQSLLSIGDVVRYVPGVTAHQGENNRDQIILRGNSSSADFFLNGVRDDVQYYRDLYNLERFEVLKGPNAMIFGRGGGGGVINRVTKEAGFEPSREISVLGGSYENTRVTADFNQPLTDRVALRVNGMYQEANSFRDYVDLERQAVNPTMTFSLSPETRLTLGYDYLHDTRLADRGISSFEGKPADVDPSTYYGNPDASHVRANVNVATATIEHSAGDFEIRNRTMFGDYDRFYQNFVPGAVDPTKTLVTLTSYNNATRRKNLFSQTDLTYPVMIGSVRHSLLAGAEFGRQVTDNFRNTGFFNDTTTSILVPYANPTVNTPVTFRQSATDADNHLTAKVAAAYVQDQIEFTEHVQLLVGARFDRFELDYLNNRNGTRLDRTDDLFSPRAGLVIKPIEPLTLYASYSVSHLPSSGDQFSSLTTVTEGLKPEEFENHEIGAKWDIGGMALTAALYQLDRTHTRATDPNDPTRIVLTGSQRTSGFELGLAGNVTDRWEIAGGYAYQDAHITSATTSAPEGARVGQVPRHSISLWNRYQFLPKFAVGVGVIHRSDMYATISDTVTLPGYTRVDAAAYYTVSDRVSLQMNVENLFDRKYFVNADSNTNITPGSPRTALVSISMSF